ncbi:MAG: peptidoglycan DD-metalloendopeptidase family protein [Fibrobacter sp.]|nr:peptidoglycan DD-metalloendopeptidase family protein [Fibrobacter sp.]
MDRKPQCCSQISGLTFFFLITGILCVSGISGDELTTFDLEIRSKAGALDSIKNELARGRSKLKDLQKEEGNYLERLEQVEKNIGVSRTYLIVMGDRIDTVEHVIASLEDSLKSAEKRLSDRQAAMKKRLRQAYMSGSPHPLLLMLNSKGPMDFIHRTRYLEELNRYDRELINEIVEARSQIDRSKKERQQEKERLTKLLDAKKQEQQAFLKEETLRKTMLESVRSKKKAFTEMITELEAAQKELNSIIRLLEEKRKKAKQEKRKGVLAFEKSKGKLPWPVEGPILANFGKVVHPVYKTVTMNNGVDIGAKKGAPVSCVAPGTVIHVGWMRGLGRLVIVDHTSGYITIYAHLDQIDVSLDQEASYGTVLGRVGDSGSIGGEKLHFEIRKSTSSLNPVEWLERAGK